MLATADAAVVPAQASDLLDEEDAVAMAMMAAFDDVDAKITEHLGVAGGAAETAAGAAASAVLRSADESAPTQQESVGEAPLSPLLAEAPTDEAVAAPATVETSICTKCKLERQGEGSGPWFVCKRCNCKRSTLSQLFGYWPVDLFTALPEQQQIAFWRAETKTGLISRTPWSRRWSTIAKRNRGPPLEARTCLLKCGSKGASTSRRSRRSAKTRRNTRF